MKHGKRVRREGDLSLRVSVGNFISRSGSFPWFNSDG